LNERELLSNRLLVKQKEKNKKTKSKSGGVGGRSREIGVRRATEGIQTRGRDFKKMDCGKTRGRCHREL